MPFFETPKLANALRILFYVDVATKLMLQNKVRH